MLIAALAAVSAQATVITFDEAGHTHGGTISGINGWTILGDAAGERTFNSVDVGGTGNMLYHDNQQTGYNRATKAITGDIAGVTTVSFLVSHLSSGIGEFSITSGAINLGNGENVGAAMWLWMDGSDEAAGVNDKNFQVIGNGAGNRHVYNYIRGEDYLFTATLDYNNGQILSSSLQDLTGSLDTQSSSTAIPFYVATTLAEAQASTSIVIGGEGRVGYDDITIIPEPATLGLLGSVGAGLLFIRRKFVI